MGLLIVVILILLLIGGLPRWDYSRQWGYVPSGLIGTILIVIVVLILFTDVIQIWRL